MAYATSMLPKWDGADMELLDIINGTNCKITFFGNCKAVKEREREEKQLVNLLTQ